MDKDPGGGSEEANKSLGGHGQIVAAMGEVGHGDEGGDDGRRDEEGREVAGGAHDVPLVAQTRDLSSMSRVFTSITAAVGRNT